MLRASCACSDTVRLGELLIKGTFARFHKGSLSDGTSVLIKTVTGTTGNVEPTPP